MSDELTDEEWAELQENRRKLQEAYAKDPAGTLQAMKDAVKAPKTEDKK